MSTEKSLEDTWYDILLKATKGLGYDSFTLANHSGFSETKIASLLQGNREDETLAAIAPALGLDPKALLHIAEHPFKDTPPTLPKNFKCFSTLYHGMQVHSYLLWSEKNKKAVAFDTGADLTPLLKILEKEALTLSALFLTHAHGDHCCKFSELVKKTEVAAWMNPAELIPGAQPLPADFFYHLDDCITVTARSAPGHSPGSTAYVIAGLSTPAAVVGDALFAGSVGGMSSAVYKSGLKNIWGNILSLAPETILAPGHGPCTTVAEEQRSNPFFASLKKS